MRTRLAEPPAASIWPSRASASTTCGSSSSCAGANLPPASRRSPAAARQSLLRRRARLEQASAKLAALSPVAILERGYSLIFDAQGALVKDAAQLAPGDPIQARLARGQLRARVESRRNAAPDNAPGASGRSGNPAVDLTAKHAPKAPPSQLHGASCFPALQCCESDPRASGRSAPERRPCRRCRTCPEVRCT